MEASASVEKTLKLVIVDPDGSLKLEFDGALEGMRRRTIAHYARDTRRGLELARSHQPDMVFAPLGRDLRTIRTFAEELSVAAPDAWLATVYKREAFGGADTSEGAIIIEALRSRVTDFLRRPISSAELRALLDRYEHRPARRTTEPGTVVTFASNKGGVGKSTLAVNTAVGLARKFPDRVLLVDASLQIGHCSSMLDLQPEATIADAVHEWDRLDETFVRQLSTPHPSGLRLLPAPLDASEAAEVHAEAMSRIVNLARRTFDFVIVDTFPMLDSVVIAILDASDRVYVVLHGLVPTVLGVVKYLEMLARIGVSGERRHLILNEVHPRFMGALRQADVAQKLGRDLDHVIPFDKKVLLSANTGEPYVLSARRGLFSSGYAQAMGRLLSEIETLRANPPERGTPAEPASAPAVDSPEAEAPVAAGVNGSAQESELFAIREASTPPTAPSPMEQAVETLIPEEGETGAKA
jgi:pilus assembly protein CpaE